MYVCKPHIQLHINSRKVHVHKLILFMLYTIASYLSTVYMLQYTVEVLLLFEYIM